MNFRSHRIRLVTPLAVLLLAACQAASTGAPPEPPPSAPSTSTAAPAPGPADSATGILSEEAFKALHQLSAEKAPPARGQMIDLGGARAYLGLPKDAKPPIAGVVVIHEWWGLNEHIMHWADRLSEDGYAAIAVDLYGGKVATTPDEAMATMKAVDAAKALATLRAAHSFLAKDPRVAAKRTGVLGWCFGGAWSLKLAQNEPELDAVALYYGHVSTDPAELKTIRAPLLGIFGNLDKSIPKETVDAFDKALHDAGVQHEILRYDAEHAFANPSNPRYETKSAADAWEHVRKLFAAKLKG